MSMISALIESLREDSDLLKVINSKIAKDIEEAIVTIEELGEKVYKANMERSERYYQSHGESETKTTQNITDRNPHDRFHCSECGFKMCDWDAYDFEDETDERFSYDFAMKYCPNCGRKVEK